MWTPRRIVMFSLVLVTFFSTYLGYAYTAIGRIDGLPPLPEMYWPNPNVGKPRPVTKTDIKSKITRDLIVAFGEGCPELDRPIRLTRPAQNMVLSAGGFSLSQDGRVCLTPISIAMFGKEGDITTLRADVAWITFDRPVHLLNEISSRKLTEAELSGNVIKINNNRRRKERDQDLDVVIKNGPVYYREDTRRIWTKEVVELTDHRGKPKPHTVVGKGLEMELLAEAPPAKPGAPVRAKPARASITGIKWLELQSGVVMKFFLDGTSGFLAAPTTPVAPAPTAPGSKAGAQKKPELAELTIRTPGKFRYEINKDHDLAKFDAEVVGIGQTPNAPPQVFVDRHNLAQGKHDQLICQHLTLRLKRKDDKSPQAKTPPPAKSTGAPGEGIDIQSAHAVSTGKGRYVLLTSDADGLHAECNDFFHDVHRRVTILKAHTGSVHVTYKDETKIQASELELQDIKPIPPPGWKPGMPLPTSARPYQKIRAKGQGWVELVEKGEGKSEKKTVRAEWSQMLTSDRIGVEDVLTLIGNARFIDLQAQQTLKADQLKVGLDAPEEVKSQPASGVTKSRKPRWVDATGHVVARSKDMNIHDTSRLYVKFIDVPATKHLPAGTALPPPKTDKRPAAVLPGAKPVEEVKPREFQSMPKGTATGKVASKSGVPGPLLGKPDEQGNQKPFDLTARTVEAVIERSPIKNVIDVLDCVGQVKVKQEPNKAEEKGTDIAGDKLKMTAGPDGYYHLTVIGDLAELSTDKIYICGPEVNIDQSNNKVWVVGDGAMQMESVTNFQGEKLHKPVPMTVHWAKHMLFDGLTAEFAGDIQATQQNARLASQSLMVMFDRMVSLKQGNKKDEPARVKKMVADTDVRIEDVVKDPKDERKVLKYTALQSPTMHMDALDPDDDKPGVKAKGGNKVTARGPGTFRVWEPSNGADPTLNESAPLTGTNGKSRDPKAVAKKPAEVVMKMTHVTFERRMDANSQTNMATFWGKVQVLNLPWPRHDKAVNLEQLLLTELPEGALYLRCDNNMRVLDHPTDGKPNKQMEGHGNVYVQGKDFHAYAQSVYYNQQKQQVILKGTKENPAVMYRVPPGGGRPESASGETITHNRDTGKTDVKGATGVQGENSPKR